MKVVVIPATYNEKDNIERLLTIMQDEVFPRIKNHEMHILVADDNSPDGTGEVVQVLMKKWKNLQLNTGEKKGLGAAYIRAMSYAIEKMNADVVISIDADLQFDPREIPNYLKKIDEGYDVVTGTRYSEGGSMPPNWPLHRKAFSIVGNTLVRTISGRFYLHDWTGGFRAYRKEVFLKERERLRPFSGYTFQVAAMYKALLDGYKITEVPVHFKDRTLGNSKIAPLEYIVNLLKYVCTERIMELKRLVKFLFVGGTGFLLQILVQEITIRSGFSFFIAGILGFLVSFITPLSDISTLGQAIGAGLGAETAILSNFMFNNYWTFNDTRGMKERSKPFVRLAKFNTTSLISIFIQSAAVWIGIKLLGNTITLASINIPTRIMIVIPTIIALIIPLNYFIYNRVIWKTQYLKHGETS